MDGYHKLDLPTKKKLPVKVDVPEHIARDATRDKAMKKSKKYKSYCLLAAIGDMCLIAYYYLHRVREYTVKGYRNESKQTKQF